MFSIFRLERGFSLIELMMVVAVAATLMAVSVPILMDVSEGSKLSTATREVERELQSARLRAVSVNRILRVRFNCPGTGYFRTVEYLANAQDTASNRCLMSAYPYPAADTDLTTRPNHDGPMRTLFNGATVTSAILEFRPDGTVHEVVANLSNPIAAPISISVTRNSKTKTVTVNGAGKIQLQLQ
jgi:prepilin-type N-terminal cleavage/methylation domain-containing protein